MNFNRSLKMTENKEDRKVIIPKSVSGSSGKYHTARCQAIRKQDADRRRTTTLDLALNFYEYEKCSNCQEMDEDLPSEVLEKMVNEDNRVWNRRKDD